MQVPAMLLLDLRNERLLLVDGHRCSKSQIPQPSRASGAKKWLPRGAPSAASTKNYLVNSNIPARCSVRCRASPAADLLAATGAHASYGLRPTVVEIRKLSPAH